MSTLSTTFALLRTHNACREGYAKLARHLGSVRKYGARTPISLLMVLESNGLMDALWCLRAVPKTQAKKRDRLGRLLACDFAEHVLPHWERTYPTDYRPHMIIEIARRYANGKATKEELATAARAADAAAAHADADAYSMERRWQTERFRKVLEEAATP